MVTVEQSCTAGVADDCVGGPFTVFISSDDYDRWAAGQVSIEDIVPDVPTDAIRVFDHGTCVPCHEDLQQDG